MKKQPTFEFSNEFSQTLATFLGAPAPEAMFISGLEQRLLEHQAQLLSSRSFWSAIRLGRERFSASVSRHKWQYATLVLLLALMGVFLALGPRRVVAQVEHWLGYVPNVGFVDLIDARVLASPVEMTRDHITLRIEEVFADRKHTKVVFSNPRLTEEEMPYPNEAIDHPDFVAYILLPDGTRLEPTKWEISVGSARLEFPALPPSVYKVSLLVPRLPLTPAGAFPEDWEIPITLLPANGKLVEEIFPQPYSPENACDSNQGITLCILNVAQSSKETGVQYQFQWSNPNWENFMDPAWDSEPRIELRDNLGHIYDEKIDSGSIGVVSIAVSEASQEISNTNGLEKTDTTIFPELSLSASQATLLINAIEYEVFGQGSFSIDLGDHPKVGDVFPLESHLDVAGIPMHLTGARLITKTEELDDGQYEQYPALEIEMDPPVEQGGMSLQRVDFLNEDLQLYCFIGKEYNLGEVQFGGQVSFQDTGHIPTGVITLQMDRVTVQIRGPWEITWNIPGKDPANAVAPVRLQPTPASSSDHEIQPVIKEVFLSDLLTAIKLDATNLPAGTSFSNVLPFSEYPNNPFINPMGIYLEDNLGYRYTFASEGVRLASADDATGYHSGWLYYLPMQLFAKSIHVHIPAIELQVDGQADFTVDVPQNPVFKVKNYDAYEIGGGEPIHRVTTQHWVTDPWTVDIRFNIAGYEVRLTQAQIDHEENRYPSYQLILTGDPPDQIQAHTDLNSLAFTSIEKPDGQIIAFGDWHSRDLLYNQLNANVGPTGFFSSHNQIVISMDVTAPNGVDILSGSYHIEVNGAIVWDKGPWDTSLSLPGK